jgi:hypothetical protein
MNEFLAPVKAELDRLRREHDLTVNDVRDPRVDPVLKALDRIVSDKFGKPYSAGELRQIIAEAVDFRYPNLIPPGYEDADKPTRLRQAGDYILWRQVLEFTAGSPPPSGSVLLVTGDVKEDWWELTSDREPRAVRRELVEEFRRTTGVDMVAVTTRDFLKGAAEFLGRSVSQNTLAEVEATLQSGPEKETEKQALDIAVLAHRTTGLFDRFGYRAETYKGPFAPRPGLLVTDETGQAAIVGFQRPDVRVGNSVRQLSKAAAAGGYEFAILILTRVSQGPAKQTLASMAARNGVRLLTLRGAENLLGRGGMFSAIQEFLRSRAGRPNSNDSSMPTELGDLGQGIDLNGPA